MSKEDMLNQLIEDGFTLDKYIIFIYDDLSYDIWERSKAPKSIVYAEEKLKDYFDLMENNPEDYKQYEQLWWEVNNMYDKARDNEINSFGFESSTDLWSIWDGLEKRKWYEHVSTKGMVPYCFDNYYTNVDEMLSAGGYRAYVRKKSFKWYEQDIKKWSWDQINKFLVPYLSVFTSWTTLGIVSSDSAQDKMTKFFDATESTEERKQQLDMFFRQYGKMMTYVADKNNALKIKYATPILKVDGYDWDRWPSDPEEQEEMLLEATNDKDRIETNLSWTPYQAFRESKVLWASKVLEKEWLLNSDVTFELQEIIDDLDQDAENIIWWFESNAILDAKASLLERKDVDQNTKQWLSKVCDNLMEDIWDEQNPWWFHEHFDYMAIALDLDSAQKEEILKHSWMWDCLTWLKSDINKLRSDVLTNPTIENVEKLNNLTWEYLALKKEFELMMYAISQAKENKDTWDYVVQIFNWITAFIWHTFNSMFDVLRWKWSDWDIPYFFLWLSISWTALVFTWRSIKGIPGRVIAFSWRVLQWAGAFPITMLKYWRRQLWFSRAISNKIIRIAKDWDKLKAGKLLAWEISKWKINKKWIARAAQEANLARGQNVDAIFEDFLRQLNIDDPKLVSKYYWKNKKIWKIIFKREWNSLQMKKTNIVVDDDWLKTLKRFDDNMKKIGPKPKSYFDDIFKKVRTISDLDYMWDLASDRNFLNAIENMDSKQIKTFKRLSLKEVDTLREAKKLGSNIDDMMTYLWKNKNQAYKSQCNYMTCRNIGK